MTGATTSWSARAAYRRLWRACQVAFHQDEPMLRAAAKALRHEFQSRPPVRSADEAVSAQAQVDEAVQVLRRDIKRARVITN
jgi:hypothetical protein